MSDAPLFYGRGKERLAAVVLESRTDNIDSCLTGKPFVMMGAVR